jgi:hypothetical protein
VVAGVARPDARAEGEVVAAKEAERDADEVVTVVADAPAGHHRVVLMSMPSPVEAATETALAPWSIAVAVSVDSPPATDDAAATVARSHDASAVAWLDGGELHVYDDLRHATEHRPVPEPRSEADAAAIALSIKTTLRRPMPVVALVEAPAPPPEIEAPAVTTSIGRVAPPRLVPHVAIGLGLLEPLSNAAPTLTRIAGRVSVDVPDLPQLAVGVTAAAGPAAPVEGTDMSARYRDIGFGAIAEWRQPLTRGLWLVPAAGASVHRTRLWGSALNGAGMDRPIDVAATLVGFDVELALEGGGSHLRGGAVLGASVTSTPAPYKVRGEEVLRVPTASLGVAIRVSFQ